MRHLRRPANVRGTRSRYALCGERLEERLPLAVGVDTRFGSSGSIDTTAYPAAALAIDPQSGKTALISNEFTIRLYDSSGVFDTSYGSGGVASFDLPGRTEWATDAIYQPDGKLLVVGLTESTSNYIDADMLVVRFTNAGMLDTSFGSGGFVRISFPDRTRDTASCTALQQDGRILVSGESWTYENRQHIAVARLTASGQLDATFDRDGRVVLTAMGKTDEDMVSVDIVADEAHGRIHVLAHSHGFWSTSDARSTIAAIDFDGDLDGWFDDDGIAVLPSNFQGNDLAVDSGSILVGGAVWERDSSGYGVNSALAVARIRPSGSVDSSFGQQGIAGITHPTYAEATRLHVRDDGTIVVVGATRTNESSDPTGESNGPVLTRLTSRGTLDQSLVTPESPFIRLSKPWPDFGKIRDCEFRADGTVDVAANGWTRSSINRVFYRNQISPVLIVTAHGQEADAAKILPNLLVPVTAWLGPLKKFADLVGVDMPPPPSGDGRGPDPWQSPLAKAAYELLVPSVNGEVVKVTSLAVNWDSWGSNGTQAEDVAQAIEGIVSDVSCDSQPWDIFFVGHSRGGVFVTEVMRSLDIVGNRRIDHVEAVLLDPTAAKVFGDVWPAAVPAGVDKIVHYDDGYAFPLTQPGLTVKAFGKRFSFPMTADGNNSPRIAGAEYRNVQDALVDTSIKTDAERSLAAHSLIPAWYIVGDGTGSGDTPLSNDFQAFIDRKDAGYLAEAAPGDFYEEFSQRLYSFELWRLRFESPSNAFGMSSGALAKKSSASESALEYVRTRRTDVVSSSTRFTCSVDMSIAGDSVQVIGIGSGDTGVGNLPANGSLAIVFDKTDSGGGVYWSFNEGGGPDAVARTRIGNLTESGDYRVTISKSGSTISFAVSRVATGAPLVSSTINLNGRPAIATALAAQSRFFFGTDRRGTGFDNAVVTTSRVASLVEQAIRPTSSAFGGSDLLDDAVDRLKTILAEMLESILAAPGQILEAITQLGQRLIDYAAEKGEMLAREFSELSKELLDRVTVESPWLRDSAAAELRKLQREADREIRRAAQEASKVQGQVSRSLQRAESGFNRAIAAGERTLERANQNVQRKIAAIDSAAGPAKKRAEAAAERARKEKVELERKWEEQKRKYAAELAAAEAKARETFEAAERKVSNTIESGSRKLAAGEKKLRKKLKL